MPSAEIITIGTEILLGEIVDTNSAFLARHLRDLNVDVFRTSTVGDNIQRIAVVLRETLERTQIIITTGGLGPTVDDPTREAVALAFGLPSEFRPELWEQIVERMRGFGHTPGENQKRQAYAPQGALGIRNPVGTAPAFIVEQGDKCVIALPGVPREMEYLAENEIFPYLRQRYHLTGSIKARVLHCAGLGESIIDERIGDLEQRANPTVGLAAHYSMVDVRITAKADDTATADAMIAEVEQILYGRLGDAIFGADEETLEGNVLNQLEMKGWTLTVVEANTGGELSQRLSATRRAAFAGGQILPSLADSQSLAEAAEAQRKLTGAHFTLALTVQPQTGRSSVDILLVTPEGQQAKTYTYGGHPKNVPAWGANNALNLLRKKVIQLDV